MDTRQVSGYVMAGIGFTMLLVNALAYLLGWDSATPAFTVIGLVFVVIGLKTVKGSGPG
jgi:hypothetical protein